MAIGQPDFRVELAREYGIPAPRLSGFLNKPIASFHARKVGANDDERMERSVGMIPALLDHVDKLIGDGVIGGEEPTAADFQIGTTVRVMMTWEDLAPAIEGRPAAKLATSLMPEYPNHVSAGRVPAAWLEPLRV